MNIHDLKRALLRAMPYVLALALLPAATAASVYDFSLFNFPGTTETWAYGISDNGQIVGQFRDSSGMHGYTRSPGGSSYIALYGPSGEETSPYGINDNGTVVGLLSSDGWQTGLGFTCNADGTGFTISDYRPFGINDAGQTAGAPGAFYDYGVIRNASGDITTFTIPGAQYVWPRGINDNGQVVGNFRDAAGQEHGFIRSSDGNTITVIDVPGAAWTYAWSINDAGWVVGWYSDGIIYYSYLRSPDGASFAFPGQPPNLNVYPHGINDRGQIVGETGSIVGISGALGSPDVPEPATSALLGAGLLGLLILRRNRAVLKTGCRRSTVSEL